MKKFLLSLLCVLTLGLTAKADEFKWEYGTNSKSTITGSNNTSGTVKIGDVTWTFSASDKTNITNEGTFKGIKVGGNASGTAYFPSTITFSTDYFKNKKILSIVIGVGSNAKANSTYNNTISFSIDGSKVLDDSALPKASTNESSKELKKWDGNVNCSETVSFTFNLDKSNTVYALWGPVTIEYIDITGGAIDPEFKVNPNPVTVTIGETVDFPEISPADLNYSFSTDDSSVIELDANAKTKTIKGLAIGKATVNFTTEAVENQYNAGSGSFEVEVVGKAPKFAFRDQVVYGKLGVGVVWQQVAVTDPAEADLMGDITYSTSDPEVLTVDAATGRINKDDIKKAGVAVITAKMAAKGDYAEASTSYTILVKDPAAEIKPGTVTFDFTTENAYGMTTQTGNSTDYETKITEIYDVDKTVTVSFSGIYRSWKASDTYELRVNKSSDTATNGFTISVPDGYKITKVTLAGGKVNGSFESSTANAGSWTPAKDAGIVTSVTYQNTSSDTNKINTITVEYEAASSNLKSAALSFEKTVNGIYVDEEATIDAVKNPNNGTISYKIYGLSDSDYTITPSEDGATINVLVSVPGSYTLEATCPGTDEYRDGFAIMRLNVYRHLTVYIDGEEWPEGEETIQTADGALTLTMDIPQNAYLYYKLTADTDAGVVAVAESDDENQLDGFTKYEDGINIDQNYSGKLEFYIANYGFISPIRTINLSVETGVKEIEAAAEGVIEYYNLQGVRVNNPERGVYIRVCGDKVSKVII